MLEIMKQGQYTMAVAIVKMEAFMKTGSLAGLHPNSDLFLEKDTAFPAWLSHVEADLWAAIDEETKTHTLRATHFSLVNLPEKGHLAGNSHGQWSSEPKHSLIGKYVRVLTRAHESIIVVRVKDCGCIKMSDLTEVDLASEGLPRDLTSHQQKVILRRMLHGFDATNMHEETSYVFRMSFEKVKTI
jgi:hypothetical protein